MGKKKKKKQSRRNNKKKKKKNAKKLQTNITNDIDRIKNDFGETVRNITLSVFRKKKKVIRTEIKHNIARQRISNFRTNLYKSELLKKTQSFKLLYY